MNLPFFSKQKQKQKQKPAENNAGEQDAEATLIVEIENLKNENAELKKTFKEKTLEFQADEKRHLEIIDSLKKKIKGLEEMVREQEKLLNGNKPTDDNNNDNNKQINNLKTKIKEMENEMENMSRINFEKNQEINKLQKK